MRLFQIAATLMVLSFGSAAWADVNTCEKALRDLKKECEGQLSKITAKVLSKKADGSHAEAQAKELRSAQEKLESAAVDCRDEKAEFDKACDPEAARDKSEKAKMKQIANEAAGVTARINQKKLSMEAGMAKARHDQEKAAQKKK